MFRLLTTFVLCVFVSVATAAKPARPNILWITCEDISPHLGCYGDEYAVTPNLDRLARRSVRYTNAFAPIGVCAPSRSCLITGMFPPSIGTQHMRCQGTLPAGVKCYSQYLREAGYYCTNNSKTDYNFTHPKAAWDESSNKAHWRNRRAGQPFFAIFNFVSCHESQIRLGEGEYQKRTAKFTDRERHDPAKAAIPPYHPDTPEVRRDWARYADMITFMDGQVGEVLRELEADGLADDTIVFFYSDHGAGMPRSKRWLYDSSLRVPLLIHFPAKFARFAPAEPGSTTDRLVSFLDFAPTLLQLTGVDVPLHMQGTPFLGEPATPPREYIYGFRDRMDERIDMLRCVRDKRFKYIRNFHPHQPWFHHQYIGYMYEMPTMRVWQSQADQLRDRFTGPPAIFMAPQKPPEELYDAQADPHEIRNLAGSPEHQETLVRLRKQLAAWQAEILDLSFLPEADLRTRFGKEPPYDAVRRDRRLYPYERIAAAADLASQLRRENLPKLEALLGDDDPATRYWAATGIGALGWSGVPSRDRLETATRDKAAFVRVAAADALCRIGATDVALPVLAAAMADDNDWVRLAAINTLDRLDATARPVEDVLRRALDDKNQYVVRVAEKAVRDLK